MIQPTYFVQHPDGTFSEADPQPTTEPMVTPALRDEFEALTGPVIKWLCENFHPHVHVVITPTSAELSSGETAFTTEAYLRD